MHAPAYMKTHFDVGMPNSRAFFAKKARELGIPTSKWVFMYAGACINDIWNVSDRVDYSSSPAIKACSDNVFELADVKIEELNFIDL